jgi:mannose-6-phosphate isomerase-like protein (cupin superfamily)
MTDLAAFRGAFADLPRELMPELALSRSAVRMDDALVVFNWVQPPSTLPLHDHPFDQLALILQGRGILRVDDEAYELGPGEFAYIPAGATHGLEAVGTEPVLNVDVFSPAREDYLHLVEEQPRV